MYLLYDVTPDSSLTGGPWWSNGEFDNQFVELLHKICSQLLEKRLVKARQLEVFIIDLILFFQFEKK